MSKDTSKNTRKKPKTSWFSRLRFALRRTARNESQLLKLLEHAQKRHLLDHDAVLMTQGVIQIAKMHARDIMVPRSQMVTLNQQHSVDELLAIIIESGHSRFPVEGDDQEEIIGVLLAKDLLHCDKENFNIGNLIRPAIFVPESKRLNTLLKDFRVNHNHIAIVSDEYGGIAGLITIEDILEQIVGDIEDEYDMEEESNIKKFSEQEYILKATTTLDEFNEHFNCAYPKDEYDTVAGLVIHKIGHLPKRKESVEIDSLKFTVLRADKRRVHLLAVEKISKP